MKDDHYSFLTIYTLTVIALVSWGVCKCTNSLHTQPKDDVTIVERWDTMYIVKHDTMPVVKEKNVIKYVTIEAPAASDSVAQSDSVGSITLPVVQKRYSDDSTYTAYVSGLEYQGYPMLDSITCRQQVVTHTIHETTMKRKPFTFGLQVGAGYGICNKKPDIYIGVGCQLNLW